jgi:hypothetical protein
MARTGQFICYAPGCGRRSPINLSDAITGGIHTCEHCGKDWIGTFKGRTCCSLTVLFVSVESGTKKPLSKIQSFKLK